MKSAWLRVGLAAACAACQTPSAQRPSHNAAQVSSTTPSPAVEVQRPSGAAPAIGAFGVDLSARDRAVEPGDDFYAYANGTWLKNTQLKPDEMMNGSFITLVYRMEDDLKAILDELAQTEHAPGSDEQKLLDYYASYMDVAALNEKGIAPLKPELDRIAAIKSREQLIDAFGRAALEQSAAPIEGLVSIDSKNPDRSVYFLGQSGLGLPDRDYYLEPQFEDLRTAYAANVATMLAFTGMADDAAKAAGQKVLALETEIAKCHWPRAELRDVDKTYNPYALTKLESEFRDYPWRRHFKAAGIDPKKIGEVIVVTPSAVGQLAGVIKKAAIADWKLYLSYHLLKNHAALLGDAIDNAAFAFYGTVLGGQQEQRARWKRAVQRIGDAEMDSNTGLGDALGKLYVERHFPPESKRKMDELVANLRAALRARIEGLDWMSPETKQQAFAKLDTFYPKIGYPSTWRDFSSVTITRDDLLANDRAVHRYWYDDNITRLYKPTDRSEWMMAPHAINAYYNPSFNEVVFPAGILSPPFFDPRADPAVNYGAIGAVIGHEMGHGFDDQGSKYDAKGVQRNWWTAEDRARFEARAKRLVEQYDQYEGVPGQKVNGSLTLGENIGDLCGVTVAYTAYHRSLGATQPPVLEGVTGDQRFFLGWAQVWRAKYRDEALTMIMKSDPHSPSAFRVNGVVRNFDPWYAAYDVQPSGQLYLEPGERVRIW